MVRALSSAALVRSVARACSAGAVSGCGCGPLPSKTALSPISPSPSGTNPPTVSDPSAEEVPFKWGGCSDHVPFGLWTAKRFTGAKRKRIGGVKSPDKLLGVLVDRHNDRAGRKVSIWKASVTGLHGRDA